MLNQTKAARDFLQGLGLTRDQYSVSCQRLKKGRDNSPGLIQVVLFMTMAERLGLAPKLAEYFSVQIEHSKETGQPIAVIIMEPGIERGPFGYRRKWEKGLHIKKAEAS